MISALQTIQKQNPGPVGTLNLLATLGRHVQTENTSIVDLYRLGRLVLTIDPANIGNVVIPTAAGAGSNLAPGPGVQDLFADFRDDAILLETIDDSTGSGQSLQANCRYPSVVDAASGEARIDPVT